MLQPTDRRNSAAARAHGQDASGPRATRAAGGPQAACTTGGPWRPEPGLLARAGQQQDLRAVERSRTARPVVNGCSARPDLVKRGKHLGRRLVDGHRHCGAAGGDSLENVHHQLRERPTSARAHASGRACRARTTVEVESRPEVGSSSTRMRGSVTCAYGTVRHGDCVGKCSEPRACLTSSMPMATRLRSPPDIPPPCQPRCT
jgi:hypothetical protein